MKSRVRTKRREAARKAAKEQQEQVRHEVQCVVQSVAAQAEEARKAIEANSPARKVQETVAKKTFAEFHNWFGQLPLVMVREVESIDS